MTKMPVIILVACLLLLTLTSCKPTVDTTFSNSSISVNSYYNKDAESEPIDLNSNSSAKLPSKEDSSYINQLTGNPEPYFPEYIIPDNEVPKIEIGENNMGKIKAYTPPTDDRFNYTDFEVAANVGDGWVNVPVASAKVAYYDVQANKYNTYMSSFVNFDFEGEVLLRVTSLSRDIESVAIKPYSKSIKYSKDKNTVMFKVSKACNLSFEINGDIYRNLQIYCNNFEDNLPNLTNSNVIYLKSGVHTSNNCKYITMKGTRPVLNVYDNQILYLEGGAYLEASVNVIGDNVKILGRGVIDQLFANSPDCKYDSLADKNMHMQGISLNRCKNILISGIIIRNSTSYTIIGSQCSNVTIDNIKTFACHTWSDGIDMMSSHDITIKNSFIRSCDDSIAIYASRWSNKGDAYNWLVENTVLWSDVAHTVNIGTHGSQNEFNRDEIYNLHFRNIDILEVNCPYPAYWGAIAMTVGDENTVRDCVFENIRIEDYSMSSMFYLKVKKNVSYNPNPGYLIDNILFKNISYNGDCPNGSEVEGYDAARLVKNVTFQNIVVNGKKAESFLEAMINVGAYTKNIVIK